MAITKWIPFALNYILTSKLLIKYLDKKCEWNIVNNEII